MFPLIDRRMATKPRRTGAQDRRQALRKFQGPERRVGPVDRRCGGAERRHLKVDRQVLLDRVLPDPDRHRGPWPLELLKVGLLPFVVGAASLYVTHQTNVRELETRKLIADSQLETSQIIADAQVRNAKQIAEAELRSQNLANIIQIFKEIVDENGETPMDSVKEGIVKRKFGALEVYGDDALPFLVQLRAHFTSDSLRNAANQAIDRILRLSQPDFSGRHFIGEDEPLNLRHRNYERFNLSGATFSNVNLFRAEFRGASLHGAKFLDVDLQDADFTGAILRGAVFDSTGSGPKTNLRNTNFEDTKLTGIEFRNVENLKLARFSMHALLKLATQPPFVGMDHETYTRLLMRHESALTEAYEHTPSLLSDALNRLGIDNIEGLRKRFAEIREIDPDMASLDDDVPSNPNRTRFSDRHALAAILERH